MKTIIPLFLTLLASLSLFAVAPEARAVMPPPDGGYPGGNTAEGQSALLSLTTGGFNTGVGFSSLRTVTAGSFNTALGAGALFANTADSNTAIGAGALFSNNTGTQNTANGPFALFLNTAGSSNTAMGFEALFSNTIGNFNTAFGSGALDLNTAGIQNTAVGGSALQGNTAGDNNTAIGENALSSNISGSGNTAVGRTALFNNTTGDNNTIIGVSAGSAITTASNVVCIGATLAGEDVSNGCYIANIFNQTSSSGSAVFVNGAGKLGTSTSSQRFKEAIKPMDEASKALFALKPVSFRYKKEIDPAGTAQLGLVAEDVEDVNPDLVVRDKEGKPYSVRYDQVNAMLLNEFLKEHKAFVEEQNKVRKLEATVADLAAGLRKVSAQVQVNSAAKIVVTNQ
jgi:hypothetical protein